MIIFCIGDNQSIDINDSDDQIDKEDFENEAHLAEIAFNGSTTIFQLAILI